MSSEAPAPVPARHTRRIVTGHDKDGHSVIADDSVCSANAAVYVPDFSINDAWRVDHLPCDNRRAESGPAGFELEPVASGNVFRIVHIPPDREYLAAIGNAGDTGAADEVGASSSSDAIPSPHPAMHRTNTLDYVVIISGEIYCVMEKGETLLRPGDVLIQRGTNHAWSNRSDQICVMAAVLNGALPYEQQAR